MRRVVTCVRAYRRLHCFVLDPPRLLRRGIVVCGTVLCAGSDELCGCFGAHSDCNGTHAHGPHHRPHRKLGRPSSRCILADALLEEGSRRVVHRDGSFDVGSIAQPIGIVVVISRRTKLCLTFCVFCYHAGCWIRSDLRDVLVRHSTNQLDASGERCSRARRSEKEEGEGGSQDRLID